MYMPNALPFCYAVKIILDCEHDCWLWQQGVPGQRFPHDQHARRQLRGRAGAGPAVQEAERRRQLVLNFFLLAIKSFQLFGLAK